MQLLCIGDVAIADDHLQAWKWPLPAEASLADETRVLLNWELPVANKIVPTPRSSGPRLLAHPNSPHVIQSWSPGFVTLATNHILDGGREGLDKTIRLLTQAGFATVGAGQTQEELAKPLFWETEQGVLAIVNWVFPETHPEWMHVPGPNCWPGLTAAAATIKNLKREVDWILLVLHWSDELFLYPRPEDRITARELAHMGVDLIVSHHPHVVRGMEIIGSCPVFYSIGDFYFSDIRNSQGHWVVRRAPRNREGVGLRILFRRDQQVDYQPLSFWQRQKQVSLDPFHRAVRRMKSASRPLQLFQDTQYATWYGIQRARFNKWGYRWNFGLWQLDRYRLMGHLSKHLPASWHSVL